MRGVTLVWAVLSCFLAILSGCNGKSLSSKMVDPLGKKAVGITYFLPRGYIFIDVKSDTDGKITITQPVAHMYPDFAFQFVVRLLHISSSADHFTVETDTNGLLKSINTTNEDKSVDIVQKLIELATEVAKGAALAPEQKNPPFEITTEVDPFDEGSVRELQRSLAAKTRGGTDLTISFSNPYGVAASLLSYEDAAQLCKESLCFRLLVPIMVEILQNKLVIWRSIVVIPDPTKIAGFNVTRAACVKKTTTLTFTSGILTKSDIDAPSETLGCMEIPIDVAKAVVSIPSAVLDFKVHQINEDQKLIDAQRELLDAQRQLLASQQKSATPPPAPGH